MPKGTNTGKYRVHYENGTVETFPIIDGEDLYEWLDIPGVEKGLSRATIAWRGKTPAGGDIRLFRRPWENPHPETKVVSLDFISAETPAAPFPIAITAE